MADEADRAADYQAHMNATAHRAHAMPVQVAPGRCVWCDGPITEGRFCDADCAEDWGKHNRRHRNGR
jgi:hypothetical protein